MNKRLKTVQISNELAGSVFFPSQDVAEAPVPQPVPDPPGNTGHDDDPAIEQASKQASALDSMLASKLTGVVESIRKTVRQPGKEVAFVRLTADEKAQLADVLYTYKRQGTRTSENELIRIAIGLLLVEYRQNEETSVLARVLKALQA